MSIREKLFKRLFRKEYDRMKELKQENVANETLIDTYRNSIEDMEETHRTLWEKLSAREKEVYKLREISDDDMQKKVMEWCLKTLGVPFIDFANVDEDGKPPHYLADLTPEARKDWIAHLESIYTDEKFRTVLSYVINLIGNHTVQKAEDSQMRNGKIGIIGIRTLMSEFAQAHEEYVDSKKPAEEFDPLEPLPG